ncbi:hypothetical protein EJ03DRAFT_374886 [Teratosphaeria nubilosa]|uniref:Uncharacterized protein n=1 Tax=Teratosphaeria nubilosa TaxID=161662 RepID=A0A6G1L913_9PEZI|nr:hypothetical protein EJ03DRAFT_374886 [Teratosphaeria nubilosa]
MSRPGQQPVSFKTVPGRNKTQKWQQAKSYNYDGDEWGALDEFDEYRGYDDPPAPPPPAPAPAPQQRYASEPPLEQRRPHRQNSFDAGVDSERRQFSGPPAFVQQDRRGSPAVSSSSSSRRPSQDHMRGPAPGMEHDRRRERNFTNPEQVPPPLNMRGAASGPAGDSHAFPPRKSSISSQSGASPVGTMQAAKSPTTDKPLPFIRPSDIYKRIEEEKEKERASMDSSRQSPDSLHRVTSPLQSRSAADSPASGGIGRRPSMEPVSEEQEPPSMPMPALPPVEEQRASRELAAAESPDIEGRESHLPEYKPLSSLGPSGFGEPQDAAKKTSPVLPPVSRISGFGSEFLHDYTDNSSNTAPEDDSTPASPQSPEQHAQSTIERVMNAPILDTNVPQPTAFSSIQATPTTSERESDGSIDAIAQDQAPASELQHHGSDSSQGFRSVVNTAFDRKDDSSVPPTPISRDDSQASSGSAGVGRSDTTSTAGISPIMSRVPSAATAQQRQLERDAQVPPIAEESTPTQSRPESAAFGAIPRKRSPGAHSRQGSGNSIVQLGFRRSLDPPSHGSSPSRTPGYETVETRRLSGPMAAVTVNDAEAFEAIDQAEELPEPHLEPAETSASEAGQPGNLVVDTRQPVSTTGRGRRDTDYSMREADMAHNVNSSPDTPSFSPPIAQDAQNNQREFLRNHTSSPSSPISVGGFGRPVSPNIGAAGLGIGRSTTPGSMTGAGPDSPIKGRVREIAGNYNNLDEASRRNSNASSKSSWSNFGRSEENLALKRKGTGLNQMESGEGEEAMQDGDEMFPQDGQSHDRSMSMHQNSTSAASQSVARPNFETQQSFRPHLPGEWVSYASTPATEEPPRQEGPDSSHDGLQPSALTPRASKAVDEPVDLTPTTKKSALIVGDVVPTPGEENISTFNQVRDAGAALGASLMTAAGLTSQARDFGSTEPAVPVEQPEMRAKAPSGAISGYLKPHFARQESEATSVATSVESSVPPTPPAKDTPKPPFDGQGAAPLNKTLAGIDDVGPEGRPISGYFSGAVPLLRTDRSVDDSRDEFVLPQNERPHLRRDLSTNTAADDFESDHLRKEIVRSLGPIHKDDAERQGDVEDVERTQDALDAAGNARRVEQGVAPATAAEIQSKPLLLDQRFSWEQAPTLASTTQETQQRARKQQATMLAPGEIAPEAPYERPRSRGLHIMNADSDKEDHPVEEQSTASQQSVPEKGALLSGVVSSMSESQDNLGAGTANSVAAADVRHVDPSPIIDNLGLETSDSEGVRFPSYYQSDAARSTMIPRSPPRQQTPTPEQKHEESASPQQDTNTPSTIAAQRQSGSRIPPFREILSIKDPGERIKTYNDTRQTFANMDTGLNSWLSNMLQKHPEHANLSSQSTSPASAIGGRVGHRHSPSIMKMGSFGGGSDRKGSLGGTGGAAESPSREGGLDMEKVGQRGKDLMNKAGMLGGKAGKGMMAGGKGLFAKGKSRFGTLKGREGGSGDKVSLSPTSSRTAPSSVPLSPSQRPSAATAFPPAAAPPASREESYVPPTMHERAADTLIQPLSPITYTAPVRTETGASAVSGSCGVVGHRHGLSQAFERLRERSRSKHGRSRSSRPQSLVLDGMTGENEEERSSRSRSANISRVSTIFSLSNLGRSEAWTASNFAEVGARVEAWNHPDAEIPPPPSAVRKFSGIEYPDAGDYESEDGMERLGVLPSPTAEEFGEFMTSGETKASTGDEGPRESAVNTADIFDDAPTADKEFSASGLAVVDDSVRDPAQAGLTTADTIDIAPVQPLVIRKLRNGSKPADKPIDDSHGLQRSTSTPGRPLHERRSSALAGLPSQQRVRQLSNPAKPAAILFATSIGNGEDANYNRTSIASKPASLPFIAKHAVEDEDDLYSSTPMATKAFDAPWRSGRETSLKNASGSAEHVAEQQASAGAEAPLSTSPAPSFATAPSVANQDVSRPHTTAMEADKMSAISAEEISEQTADKKGPEDVGPADSRRSSVSSINSPVTAVGHRASMIVMQQDSAAREESLGKEANAALDLRGGSAPSVAVGKPTIVQQIMQPPLQRPANAPTLEHQRFMNRSYRGCIGEKPAERPMSFVPAPVDMPQDQDMLETVEEGTSTNIQVDVSALSGPPAGTPPFMQHPVYRSSMANVQPTEYEKLRSSPVGIPSEPMTAGHSRNISEASDQRMSKRLSAFFGRKSASKDNAAHSTFSRLSAFYDRFGIDEGHGLEDMTPDPQVPPVVSEGGNKPSKRISGIWDSIRPSSTVSRTNFSSHSSVGRIAPTKSTPPTTSSDGPDNVAPMATRSKGMLKQHQRSASSAPPPTESKWGKRRFSGLGRIFGRSNTQGHNTPKPNKLIKLQQAQPLSRESSLRRGHLGWNNDSPPSDDAAYVIRGRQQISDLHERHDHSPNAAKLSFEQPPADLDARGIPVPPRPAMSASRADTVTAPLQGWYAPGQHDDDSDERTLSPGELQSMQNTSYENPMESPQPLWASSAGQPPPRALRMSPQPQDRPAHFRRLHSASFRRGLQQAQIPEAFRPVEASYGRQAEPIGPPPQYEPPVVYQPRRVRSSVREQRPSPLPRQPTLPTRQPYWGQVPPQAFAPTHTQLPWTEPRGRQYSAVSALSAPSQPSPPGSSGQGQAFEARRESSHASISPMHSRQASENIVHPYLPQLQTQQWRIGSLDQEVARSPAKAYADQQTPYSISLPGGASPPNSRVPSSNGPPGIAQPELESQGQIDSRHDESGHHPARLGPTSQHNSGHHPAQTPSAPTPQPPLPPRQQYNMMEPDTPGHSSPQSQYAANVEGQQSSSPPPAGMNHEQLYETYSPNLQQRQEASQYYHPPHQQQQELYAQYQQRQQASYNLPPQFLSPHPQRPWSPPHTRAPDAHRPPPPHMRNRYYSALASEGRPLTYQQTVSGYSGRRDDAAVNEQEVDAIMRGASYPGQEWAPRVYE